MFLSNVGEDKYFSDRTFEVAGSFLKRQQYPTRLHDVTALKSAVLVVTNVVTYDLTCKVKRSRYRPGVAQMVGRGIALLFHDRRTRRG